jgi:glycosyltransferase involved in cell wall biosynthesis
LGPDLRPDSALPSVGGNDSKNALRPENGPVKLAVLTNILTPYRIPLFRALADRVDELTVLTMAEREENRQWSLAPAGFRTVVLPGFHVKPTRYDASLHVNYRVARTLRVLRPHAVLSGGFAPANLTALGDCRRSGSAFVGWGELTLRDPGAASLIRRVVRRWVARRSDGAIASSSEACEAFVRDGIARERVLTALMPVAVEFFRVRTAEVRQTEGYSRRRATYSRPVLVAVGQLVARKGYRELFAIYERLLARRPDATLLIVGDGPERATYERFVRTRGWTNVHFAGFVQPESLPAWLALADVFVFPTLFDPFGAVLAEAMAAGLPVASSVHAAATADLVIEGETGVRIDPRDAESSARVISGLLDLPPGRRALMGEAASRLLSCYTCDATATAIVRFIDDLLARRTTRRPHPAGVRSRTHPERVDG